MPPLPTFDHIQFGDGLAVTDLGGGVIRVDAGGGGGGGGESIEAVLNGPDTLIAAGATTTLEFTPDSSFDWLDFADPTQPVVRDAGTYAMTFNAVCSSGSVPFYVSLDYDFDDIHSSAVFPEDRGSVSLTINLPDDGVFSVSVQNRSGASHSFRIQQFIITKVGGGGGGGGGGIQFDTYPQAGGWLYVEVDGPGTGTPGGYGMHLLDSGGDGIGIISTGSINMNSDGSTSIFSDNQMSIQSVEDMVLETTGAGDILINTTGSGGIEIRSVDGIDITTTAGGIFLTPDAGATVLMSVGPGSGATQSSTLAITNQRTTVGVSDKSGAQFEILDATSGDPLFVVKFDGTIHGKASVGAITWDL